MANPTQATPADLAGEAYDAVTLSACVISELGSLFRAIYTAGNEPEHMRRLAGIGQMLADDQASFLEQLVASLDAGLERISRRNAA